MGINIGTTRLDLSYKDAYRTKALPDAYERLILDVVNGDKRLFIRNDELEEAWKIFDPVLAEIDAQQVSVSPLLARLLVRLLVTGWFVCWGLCLFLAFCLFPCFVSLLPWLVCLLVLSWLVFFFGCWQPNQPLRTALRR